MIGRGRTDTLSGRTTRLHVMAPTARRGFTLIEMLLVLAVICSLLGTMAVSLAGRRDRQALRIAAEDLAASLRFAAEQTRLTRRAHRVVFDEGLSSHRVEVATGEQARPFLPARGMAGQGRALPTGVRLVSFRPEGGEDQPLRRCLEFTPSGEGFAGAIVLKNRAGATRRVEVIRETRQVHVTE